MELASLCEYDLIILDLMLPVLNGTEVLNELQNAVAGWRRVLSVLDTPAAVHWISAEPLLGSLDVSGWLRPRPGCAHVGAAGCCRHVDELSGFG